MTWLWTTTFGMPGIAWLMMSSRLGFVAEVIATESPSQLSPVVIQRTCAVTPSVSLKWSSAAVLTSTSSVSADARQGVPHQLIHDSLAAEAGLDQHHARRLRLHFADFHRPLAAGHR